MSKDESKHASETHRARVDAMTDEEIDMSDSPELTDDFFREATWRRGTPSTLEIDPEVLAWYQAQGGDWERRLRVALRVYAEAHVRA
jgi:uncharacterized protein (DUF4415 family)